MATYTDVRDQHQATLRRAAVDAATRVLLDDGVAAVTVRRIAHELGCSTTVIYNLFGNKDSLANALYQEGCVELHRALATVPVQEQPHAYLTALAWSFWEFAQQQPQFYALMFTGALPQFTPDAASMQDVATAIGLLVAVLERYRATGRLVSDDTAQLAQMLWAALHGVIHLHVTGHVADNAAARALYARTVATLVGAILRP